MSCLFYVIFSPFILMYYYIKIIFMILYYTAMFIIYCIKFLANLVSSFSNNKTYYTNSSNFKTFSPKNPNATKKINKYYNDTQFDKEADLWGLSEEDRRIAKQERMSPADFVEAEERLDDDLDTDEW